MTERTYPKDLLYEAVPPPPQLDKEPDEWYNRFIDYYLLQVPNYKQKRNLCRAYQLWRVDKALQLKIQEEEEIANGTKKKRGKSARNLPPKEEIPPLSTSEIRRMAVSGGNPLWKAKAEEWRWDARVAVWDYQYAIWYRSKWFQRQQELREEQWRLGYKLTHKGEEIIDQPLYEEIQKQGGKTIIKKPGRWMFSDGESFLTSGLELLHQVSNQPTTNDVLGLIENMEQAGMLPMEAVVEMSALFDQFMEEFNARVRQHIITAEIPTYEEITPASIPVTERVEESDPGEEE